MLKSVANAIENILKEEFPDEKKRDKFPVVVSFVNNKRKLVFLIASDGTTGLEWDLSEQRASMAVLIKSSTVSLLDSFKTDKRLRDILDKNPRLSRLSGGVPLRNSSGEVIGGIGVCGCGIFDNHRIADRIRNQIKIAF